MGLLAESKSRKSIGKDPNNTKWTRDTTTFGQKILRSQGWEPGQFLGAKDAPHSELHTAASASYIRVALKDDMKGLGFSKAKEDEVTGLDVFSDLLSRLNGKSEAQVDADKAARLVVKTNRYLEQRWGPMRFVSGGLLVGDSMKDLLSESTAPRDDEESSSASSTTSTPSAATTKTTTKTEARETEKTSKKRKADAEAEVGEDSSSDTSSDEEVRQKKERKKRRKEEKQVKKARKEGKKDKKKDKKNHEKDTSLEPTSAVASGDESGSPQMAKAEKKKKLKKERREKEKEEKKRLKRQEKDKKKEKRKKESRSKDRDSESSDDESSGSAKPTPATSGTSTPTVLPHRNFVRSRFIAQKQRVLMDSEALKQILMVKG